jgi:transcription initiation factor TFIIIB Brf1 subunit/transcription initiation factor TFIIB
VKTSKLQIACPVCGSSAEVFYTCTPGCCFNHVCGACGTTFEPATTAAGGTLKGVVPPDPLPDATDPTVECARCTSTAVYQMENGALVCANCGTVLAMELTEIAPG